MKTLILRDWWLCTIISIMFEVLEYTLEHQLPNFSECWWDHVSALINKLFFLENNTIFFSGLWMHYFVMV